MSQIKQIKVMIVDDSPFSRIFLDETLRKINCQVVGEVESIDSLIETYSLCKPDVVTMDLVMPGSDGLECSRTLLAHDPSVKIILIGSMKDEATEAEARQLGIGGYIQKPVNEETLLRIINNVMPPDDSYHKLKTRGPNIFKETFAQNITPITKAPVTFSPFATSIQQFSSQGFTTVFGIVGRHSGTMVIDLSPTTAEKFVVSLLRRRSKNAEEAAAMVAGLGSNIAGTSCSMLNKQDDSFNLRVSPPCLFVGRTSRVASPTMELQGCHAETRFGRIFLGIGFKKESMLWM